MVYYSLDRYNDDMFLVGMLGWWYTGGWRHRLRASARQLKNVAGFFSIGQLLRTLFSPFRQISAAEVNGSAAVLLRAFFDKLISRFVGLIVRSMTILAGIVVLIGMVLYQMLILAAWLVLPLSPVAGLMLMVIGWTPSWQ